MDTADTPNFSIFKPLNEYGRKNRNMVLTMLLIWFIGVFGFQVLLKVLESPVKETSFTSFNNSLENARNGFTDDNKTKEFIQSLTLITGKSVIKADDKKIINHGLSLAVYSLLPEDQWSELNANIADTKEIHEKLATASEIEFIELKNSLKEKIDKIGLIVNKAAGFEPNSLEAELLPYNIVPVESTLADATTWKKLQNKVEFYTTHFQSKLTDIKFLGFPFHYFYTGVFLLVMFVSLCLIYCIVTQRLQKRYNVVE